MSLLALRGIYLRDSPKAYLIRTVNFGERWFPKRFTSIEGRMNKESEIVFLIPVWLFDKIVEDLKGKKLGMDQPTVPKGKNTYVIEPEMMKRLVQLCHPDKHDNSKSSLIVTQWLLEIRK